MPQPVPPLDPAREIVHHRRVKATPAEVFAAWTDPVRLARWWGPDGFTNTIHTFEPAPGGAFTLTMHGPNGQDYPNEFRFLAMDPPHRIDLDHLTLPRFQVVATFEAEGEGCRVTFRQIFADAQLRDTVAAFAVEANEQVLNHLEAELVRHGS